MVKIPRTKKSGRVAIAIAAIVTGIAWAWFGQREIGTGEVAAYVILDFIMSAASIGYGVALLKMWRENSREIWREIGILILAAGPSLRGAIKGIKGGDITFDGAMSLVFLIFCILLLLQAIKNRQHLSPPPQAK